MKSNLLIRFITGVVFVVVLVGAIVWRWESFALLFALITGLTVWEFCTIVNRNLPAQVNRFITTATAVYFFFAVLAFNANMAPAAIFIPFLLSIVYLLVAELYLNRPNPLQNWAFALMAQLYVALPFALLNTLAMLIDTEASQLSPMSLPVMKYTPVYVLAIFVFLWSSDTGAYCSGRMFGKHKLFPRISPNKTWEGTIGGGILAIVASQIFAWLAPAFAPQSPLLGHLLWAGLAVVVVIFGTWGDLVESLLKRKLGIKDSGNILPGHGGMLDRFDSSLLAIPAAVIYIYLLNNFLQS